MILTEQGMKARRAEEDGVEEDEAAAAATFNSLVASKGASPPPSLLLPVPVRQPPLLGEQIAPLSSVPENRAEAALETRNIVREEACAAM